MALNALTFSAPVIKTPRLTAGQRLILRIPLKREPLDWDLFSREQTYLFWRKLGEKHKISLETATLWGVYPGIPLNLIVKLWLDDDKTLNMYLMQQAIKPKMAYLVVGWLKKEQRLLQAAVTSAELRKNEI